MPTMSSYFYPRPPQGGRQPVNVLAEQGVQFLSTPSARRATVFGVRLMILMVISIHALRKEGDSSLELAKQMTENFYPRPPQGGRPGQAPASVCGRMISIHALRKEGDLELFIRHEALSNFYPRPPQGGRRRCPPAPRPDPGISIHALRKEGDEGAHQHHVLIPEFLSTPSARRATRRQHRAPGVPGISIHALRKEGDAEKLEINIGTMQFLSTPSARRATDGDTASIRLLGISIHALRKEGDPKATQHVTTFRCISIHALRKEGDAAWRATRPNSEVFLSTPSARRATPNVNENSTAFWHFYPRPPQGGRPPSNMSMLLANKFLSTPSARRATRRMQEPRETRSISIHALRKEGDAHRIRRWDSITQFLSTPSARRATWRLLLYMGKVCNFYPRPPRGGRHSVAGISTIAT